MTKNKFTGTGVALITPFQENGNIDFESLDKLVEYQISGGIDYLVVMGTTGEAATLTKEEKKTVVERVCQINAKRIPIVVGFGGNNTADVVQQIKDFKSFDNIDAILSVAPFYNKPSQQGIFLHYQSIAAVSPVPIIIYNVPGRTGVNITAETSLKIAQEIDKVIAIKEASGNMEQVMNILNNKPNDFLLISGDDALTFPMIQLGAAGVISVIGNAFPKEWSDMVHFALKGKNKKALELHYKMLDMIQNIFKEGNPAGVKAVLHLKKITPNYLRLPLCPVSVEHYQKIAKLLEIIQ
ncbi:4-hydroxy-tetrahydrodipicolinate synthase [Ancylomarina longa]|uniref:4-hydroxy-tetrahydrodipicolinate synthase n=1 Tax=Ancylomarina longa TaxID=2487017 RepID=A0A434AGW6_9BACT|nr:4-hydroxy-tetrahydrodipicolinate synthase [Ancylomarina longa]RUT73636.1 4-hydroxy-tetrahydrodipicolinate synthase [Ancylomarina longa]